MAGKFLSLSETLDNLVKPLDPAHIKFKGEFPHIPIERVALCMNTAVGPLNYDRSIDDYTLIECDKFKTAKGEAWFAVAVARCTVTIRVRDDKGEVLSETSHQDLGIGQAQGQKQKHHAIMIAVKSAASDAFKRACRLFGPALGLSVMFDEEERYAAEAEAWASVHDEPLPAPKPDLSTQPWLAGAEVEPLAEQQDLLAADFSQQQNQSMLSQEEAATVAAQTQQPCPETGLESLIEHIDPQFLARVACMPHGHVLSSEDSFKVLEPLSKVLGLEGLRALSGHIGRQPGKALTRDHVFLIAKWFHDQAASGKTARDPSDVAECKRLFTEILGPRHESWINQLAESSDSDQINSSMCAALSALACLRAGKPHSYSMECWEKVGAKPPAMPTVLQAKNFIVNLPEASQAAV